MLNKPKMVNKKFNPNRARLEKKKRKGVEEITVVPAKKQEQMHALDSKQMHELTDLLAVMKERLPKLAEKQAKANASYLEIESNIILYANTSIGSQVIELIIPLLSQENLEKCFITFEPQIQALCKERFGGHVLQRIFKEAGYRAVFWDKAEHKTNCQDALLRFSKEIFNTSDTLIMDTYGSHTLRSILYALSQYKDKKEDCPTLPKHMEEVLIGYANKLFISNKFKVYIFQKMATETVRVVMKIMHRLNNDLLRKYVQVIIKNLTLKMIFENPIATLVLETMMLVSTAEEHALVYNTFFKGKLNKTFYEKNGSHIVCRLLENVQSKEIFNSIYLEFRTEFKKLVMANKLALLEILCRACKKQDSNQKEFMKRLRKAYNCRTEDKLDRFVICLFTNTQCNDLQETYDFQTMDLNIHGLNMVQILCKFNDPSIIVNGFLAMSPENLVSLFSNTKGCYMADEYFKSETIERESKKRLFKKFRNMFKEFLKNEGGLKGFGAIWKGVDLKQKVVILKELEEDKAWKDSPMGEKIAQKIKFDLYESDKEAWREKIEEISTKMNISKLN